MSDAEISKSNENETMPANGGAATNIENASENESKKQAACEEAAKPAAPTATANAPLNEKKPENASEVPVENATDSADKKEIAVELSAEVKTEIVNLPANEAHGGPVSTADVKQSENIGAGDSLAKPESREKNGLPESKTAAIENVNVTTPIANNKAPITPKVNGGASKAINGKALTASTPDVKANELVISELKQAVQKAAEERDSYRRKLEITEKKLANLQASYDEFVKSGSDENGLKRMVDQLRSKLIQTSLQLDDRVRLSANQEKQISALQNQVASLKEVETLTRSLLQIRNMEVKHLQAEVDDMEVRISEERERYNTMINKMDAAVQLNADLKKEYETQLSLFRDLREKYEEKVTLLTAEKRALETAAETTAETAVEAAPN